MDRTGTPTVLQLSLHLGSVIMANHDCCHNIHILVYWFEIIISGTLLKDWPLNWWWNKSKDILPEMNQRCSDLRFMDFIIQIPTINLHNTKPKILGFNSPPWRRKLFSKLCYRYSNYWNRLGNWIGRNHRKHRVIVSSRSKQVYFGENCQMGA